MARKPKPERQRVKTPPAKDTFNSRELCARYSCSQRTIRRKEVEEEFPRGERYGRELTYGKEPVYAWERIHMPALHTSPEMSEEDKHWDRLRRHYKLEQEERDEDPPPRPPKKKVRH